MKKRILFFGTPYIASMILQHLISLDKYDIIGVVCQSDKLIKKNKIIYSETKNIALKHNIKIFQPEKLNNDFINSIINTNGLKWTPANPADGSVVPEGWTGVTWSADATNKRITKLNVYSKGLTGALDVSDLTALVRLICESNQLTSLDVSNLTAFERLDCKINKLLP